MGCTSSSPVKIINDKTGVVKAVSSAATTETSRQHRPPIAATVDVAARDTPHVTDEVAVPKATSDERAASEGGLFVESAKLIVKAPFEGEEGLKTFVKKETAEPAEHIAEYPIFTGYSINEDQNGASIPTAVRTNTDNGAYTLSVDVLEKTSTHATKTVELNATTSANDEMSSSMNGETMAILDDTDSHWLDCTSREQSQCLESREASPSAIAPEEGGAPSETQTRMMELSVSHRDAPSLNASQSGTSMSSGERLVFTALRRPRWGMGMKNGTLGKNTSTKRGAYFPIAVPGEAMDGADGVAGRVPYYCYGTQRHDSDMSHTSNYYVNIRNGAPLRFKHSVRRPLQGFGWTCTPSTSSALVASSAGRCLFDSKRPLCYEVRRVAPDGTTLSTTVVSGVAARLVRGATACGTMGTEVAIQHATGSIFNVSRNGAGFGGLFVASGQKSAAKKIGFLR